MTGTSVLAPHSEARDLTTVCCHCRRVRNAAGRWESRIVTREERVSHGICRDCFVAFYPDMPLPGSPG